MADEKKKRRGRRAYLEDFHQNVAGEYIYTGQTHAWKAPRGKTLRKLWLCAIAAIGAAVAAGCVPNTGMERRVWALIPYVLMLISSGVQGWLLYKLTDGGDPVRDYVWKASVPRLPAVGIVTGILALASIVMEIANIFAPNFAGTLPFALGLIGLDVLAGATSVVLSRTVKGLEWA